MSREWGTAPGGWKGKLKIWKNKLDFCGFSGIFGMPVAINGDNFCLLYFGCVPYPLQEKPGKFTTKLSNLHPRFWRSMKVSAERKKNTIKKLDFTLGNLKIENFHRESFDWRKFVSRLSLNTHFDVFRHDSLQDDRDLFRYVPMFPNITDFQLTATELVESFLDTTSGTVGLKIWLTNLLHINRSEKHMSDEGERRSHRNVWVSMHARRLRSADQK